MKKKSRGVSRLCFKQQLHKCWCRDFGRVLDLSVLCGVAFYILMTVQSKSSALHFVLFWLICLTPAIAKQVTSPTSVYNTDSRVAYIGFCVIPCRRSISMHGSSGTRTSVRKATKHWPCNTGYPWSWSSNWLNGLRGRYYWSRPLLNCLRKLISSSELGVLILNSCW